MQNQILIFCFLSGLYGLFDEQKYKMRLSIITFFNCLKVKKLLKILVDIAKKQKIDIVINSN